MEEEDDEPTPPPKSKRKAKKTQQPTKAKAKASAGASFDVDGPYKPGMKFKSDWSQGKKRPAYLVARKRYHCTETNEALANKVSGIKGMLKRWNASDVNEEKLAELTAAIEKWEAKMNKE